MTICVLLPLLNVMLIAQVISISVYTLLGTRCTVIRQNQCVPRHHGNK